MSEAGMLVMVELNYVWMAIMVRGKTKYPEGLGG